MGEENGDTIHFTMRSKLFSIRKFAFCEGSSSSLSHFFILNSLFILSLSRNFSSELMTSFFSALSNCNEKKTERALRENSGSTFSFNFGLTMLSNGALVLCILRNAAQLGSLRVGKETTCINSNWSTKECLRSHPENSLTLADGSSLGSRIRIHMYIVV